MIGRGKGRLSVVRQCALLDVARSSAYYRPTGDSEAALALMRRIDRNFFSPSTRFMAAGAYRRCSPATANRWGGVGFGG